MQTDTITPSDMGETACDVQFLLRRISHLVGALHDASDDVQLNDPRSQEALSRICAFADIIGEAAVTACGKAEQIELAHVRSKKASIDGPAMEATQ